MKKIVKQMLYVFYATYKAYVRLYIHILYIHTCRKLHEEIEFRSKENLLLPPPPSPAVCLETFNERLKLTLKSEKCVNLGLD